MHDTHANQYQVVIDWDNEYAIAVGAQPRNQTCAAGLEYINLDDPTNPYKPGCASSDGYTHDAQSDLPPYLIIWTITDQLM